jgi:hypothetical protein
VNVCQSCDTHGDIARRLVEAGLPFHKHADAFAQQKQIATNLLQQFFPQ